VEEKMKKVIFSIIVSLIVISNCNAEEKPIQSVQAENTNIDPQDCHCDFDAMEKEALENGYSSIEEYEEAELESITKGY
jgi:PBP1b-binding outer membrane lipoprotein LpoB